MTRSSPCLSLRNVKQLFITCIRLILTIFVILVAPIFFVVLGFFIVYRLIVSKIARFSDPKLGKMVSAMGNLFVAHDTYGNSLAVNIALHSAGKIDRMHVINKFENLLRTNITPEGALKYPELTQNVVTKFGYKFWRNREDFQMADHVTYLNPDNPDESLTLDDIREVIGKFGKMPFDPYRSLWHVYVVKNFSSYLQPSVQSAIILRLHHALFDGHAILNVFGKLADNGPLVLEGSDKIKQLESQAKNTPLLLALLRPLITIFTGPYELVGKFIANDTNELNQICRRDFKGSVRIYECEPIPLEDLKAVKNFYGVSMGTLTTTLVVRSLKKFLQSKNFKNVGKMHICFPVPIPSHPDKLRNHFSGGVISFDLTSDDRVKTLHAVEEKYRKFRVTYAMGVAEATMLLFRAVGSLPAFLTPRMDNSPIVSATLQFSSFPGPIDTGYFCGYPILDATVSGAAVPTNPIGCLAYSYRGAYKFGVLADTSIFPTKEEAYQMGNGIFEEFLEFSRQVKENVV